jgi:hypothetical protein
VIDGSQTQQWDYFDAAYGSVISVYIKPSSTAATGGAPILIRTVGARVQTDYTDIMPGPPGAAAFKPNAACPSSGERTEEK